MVPLPIEWTDCINMHQTKTLHYGEHKFELGPRGGNLKFFSEGNVDQYGICSVEEFKRNGQLFSSSYEQTFVSKCTYCYWYNLHFKANTSTTLITNI